MRVDLREWGTIHDTIATSKSIAHLWHKETAIDGKKSLLDDVARYDAKSCTWKCMQVLRILGSMLQCHENRILAVGESDDNDTRIANGYNSHSVTSNNGVCTTECTCIISCNPVALVDIFNSMSFQYKQSSIRCVRHSINRRTISNLLCVRARNFWSQARVWHKVKCVSELTLEVSHELIIRIARATPGHRWKKGCFNRSMSIVEEEL